MLKKGFALCFDVVQNVFNRWSNTQLIHIVESSDWAIKNVGESLVHSLNAQKLLRAKCRITPLGIRNQIVHFDSANTFFHKGKAYTPHASNQTILTWFHIPPGDQKLNLMREVQKKLRFIHTSCRLTKEQLVQAGIQPEKIIVIPLGVDTKLFSPISHDQKISIRHRFGIPTDRFVIGSFQKDGDGWGNGLIPKLIKGPDIFVETVSKLKHLNPFVFLTGPARGYVKQGLEKNKIEFKHVFLKKFSDISDAYRTLDVYLISSRVEGGPFALLESWASGIPIVSTRVGMVLDIAIAEQTVLLSEIEDVQTLALEVEEIACDTNLRLKLIANALQEVQEYSWDKIAKRYYHELYRTSV